MVPPPCLTVNSLLLGLKALPWLNRCLVWPSNLPPGGIVHFGSCRFHSNLKEFQELFSWSSQSRWLKTGLTEDRDTGIPAVSSSDLSLGGSQTSEPISFQGDRWVLVSPMNAVEQIFFNAVRVCLTFYTRSKQHSNGQISEISETLSILCHGFLCPSRGQLPSTGWSP